MALHATTIRFGDRGPVRLAVDLHGGTVDGQDGGARPDHDVGERFEQRGCGFAVEWMRKDLGYCLAEAARNGARLPVTALVDQLYAQVEARGGRRWDTSSLIHLLHHP